LIVAATEGEISALRADLKPDVDVLVTGIGMVATAVRCARALALTPYDLALNVGICGSFDRALMPGSVVHVGARQHRGAWRRRRRRIRDH
jgi:futalosine hydrolase